MKILILSSNLSNEAGGYAESSFLLRERLSLIKGTKTYLFGFWKSKFLQLNYILNDKINILSNNSIRNHQFGLIWLESVIWFAPCYF